MTSFIPGADVCSISTMAELCNGETLPAEWLVLGA